MTMSEKKGQGKKLILDDPVSLNHKLFLVNNHDQLMDKIRSEIYDLTVQRSYWMQPGLVLTMASAESIILRCMKQLEERIKQLADRHSKYYWFCLSRRIPPWQEGDELMYTQLLWRRTFELAILKYGSGLPDPFLRISSGINPITWKPIYKEESGEIKDQCGEGVNQNEHNIGLVPASLTTQDWTDLHLLREYACLYYSMTATLRRVWKGEMLEISGQYIPTPRPTHPITRLIELVDRRDNEFSSLISFLGHPLGEDIRTKGLHKGVMLRLVPNVNKHDFSAVFNSEKQSEWYPNYLPAPFDFDQLVSWFEEYNSAFEKIFHCGWQPIYSFLHVLAERLTESIDYAFALMREGYSNISLLYQILQRGYLVIDDFDEFKEYLFKRYEEKLSNFNPKVYMLDSQRIFNQLLIKYTSPHGEDSEIDLWARKGRKFFIYCGGKRFIADYTVWTDVLENILSPIVVMDGRIGNIRGDAFPKYARNYLTEKIKHSQIWFFNKQLKFNDGIIFEVDIGIQYRNTLYIIECANMGDNIDDLLGRPQAVMHRMNDLNRRIDKLDKLSFKVASEKTGKNWKLPTNTEWITSIVVTPRVEYLNSLDSKYWLTDDIPRVCTPDELVHFIKNFKPTENIGKPWILQMEDH